MQVETPVKGMSELNLSSPVPTSPFGRDKVPPPDSPYIRVQRAGTGIEPHKPLKEREQEMFNMEVAKCVDEATNPDPEYVPFLPLLPKTSSRLNCISPGTVCTLRSLHAHPAGSRSS